GPQRARDARDHRSRVHPLRRQDSRVRHRHRDRHQPGRARDLPRRPVRALGPGERQPMAMEARLSLRQSQRVVMTPLLQQASQLLQLSTLELQEVVQKELLENPLLEEMPVDGAETPEAGEATPSAEPPPAPAPTVEPITADPPPTAERQTDDL